MRLPRNVLSHWQTAYEGFSTPVQDFYAQVEAAVKSRQLSDVTFSRVVFKESGIASAGREYLRVSRGGLKLDICAAPYGNGFFFSSWMALDFPAYLPYLYLAVILGSGLLFLGFALAALVTDGGKTGFLGILSFYFLTLAGCGLAVHHRVMGVEEAVEAIPFIGRIYGGLFNPDTYFSIDSEGMFQSAIHGAVLEAVHAVTEQSGRRVLVVPERWVA